MKHHVYVTIDKNKFYSWIKEHSLDVKDIAEIEGVRPNAIYAHLKENRIPTGILSKIIEFCNFTELSIVDLPFITDDANDILKHFRVLVRHGDIYGDMLTSIRTYISYNYDEVRMREEFPYKDFIPKLEKQPEPPKFTLDDFIDFVAKIEAKKEAIYKEYKILSTKLEYIRSLKDIMPLERIEKEIKSMEF